MIISCIHVQKLWIRFQLGLLDVVLLSTVIEKQKNQNSMSYDFIVCLICR